MEIRERVGMFITPVFMLYSLHKQYISGTKKCSFWKRTKKKTNNKDSDSKLIYSLVPFILGIIYKKL